VNPVVMILIPVLLLVIWLYMRQRQEKTSSATTEKVKPRATKNTAYHAVVIKFSQNGCAAAKAIAGRRFLATEAPTLPLPECDVSNCDCHFAHYDDRRARQDRRSPFATSMSTDGTGSFKRERRDSKDRRSDDDFEI
jgi:hypothetical protein